MLVRISKEVQSLPLKLYTMFLFSQRARALAASGPVFSAFTPQSILRSSLRPTPVATPSASPGRSITPPLRSKESRITFIEEEESPEPEKGIRWTNGVRSNTKREWFADSENLSQVSFLSVIFFFELVGLIVFCLYNKNVSSNLLWYHFPL